MAGLQGCAAGSRSAAEDRLHPKATPQGYTHVVDADLKSYFGTIPHDRLMAVVAGSISDGRVLALIDGVLRQEIMSEMAR